MYRYIVLRLLNMIPVILLISILTFSLMLLLPGDPALAIVGGTDATEADPLLVQQLREELALDDPIPVQYARWLGRALRGDFGEQLVTGQPALKLVLSRLPVSIELGLISIALASLLGIILGTIAAVYRGGPLDMLATTLALVGVAMPNFWLALLLILLFSVELGWFDILGYRSLMDDPVANLKSMVLPAIALGTGGAAIIARMTRSSMLEVLSQDYIRTARAKGLKESPVIRNHALRNALIPVITVAGLQISNILSGSVIIETIFSLPGAGRLLVNSITHREFFVVQCSVLLISIAVVFTNLVVDIVYQFLDPRISYD